MKSIKQMMEEMGFNKEAPLESQKAFFKHLMAAANQSAPTKISVPRDEKGTTNGQPLKNLEVKQSQLEFEFPEDKRVS